MNNLYHKLMFYFHGLKYKTKITLFAELLTHKG